MYLKGIVMVIKHYICRAVEKICLRCGIIFTYFNQKGLKNVNMGLVAQIKSPYVLEKKELSASELYLGPDFLTDRYSLIGTTIVDSPHREFVACFLENKSVEATDYAKRWSDGTLDWRRQMPVSVSIAEWKKVAKKRIQEVENNNYKPVLVYLHDEKYYIYDGKHRAALCAAFGKKVVCEVIPESYVMGYYVGYMLDRIASREGYQKHINFRENRE